MLYVTLHFFRMQCIKNFEYDSVKLIIAYIKSKNWKTYIQYEYLDFVKFYTVYRKTKWVELMLL